MPGRFPDPQSGDKGQSSLQAAKFLIPANVRLVFPAPAAPGDVGRVLSLVGCPKHITSNFRAVSLPNPSGHHCQEIKKVCGASQITSGCCLWACVWDDHICGRGWHWELLWERQGCGLVASPRAVTQRGAPELVVSLLKLLPGVSSGAGASQLLPSTALGASAPSSCWFGLSEELVALCQGWCHQPVPQGRGKEMVLSYETLTETSSLIEFKIIFNNKVSFTCCPFPEHPGWLFQCHGMCDSGAGEWHLVSPVSLQPMKWPQNVFGGLPGSVPRVCHPAWHPRAKCGREQGWQQREESPGLPWQVLEGEDSVPCPCWSLPSNIPCPRGALSTGWLWGHEALQAGGTNPCEKGERAPAPLRAVWRRDLSPLWGVRIESTAHCGEAPRWV